MFISRRNTDTSALGNPSMSERPHPRRRQVVVVGAGFGGLNAVDVLKRAPVDVTVIDRRNHHLFQPLLYQVATAGLSPADIAMPVRSIFHRWPNVSVYLDEVTGVDLAAREVVLDRRRIPYDDLVIATGARHAYFGHDDWEPFAPGLKTVEDATEIRRRILLAFERAEMEPDEAVCRRLLTFAVIGGGPTGVEMAGAIAELARRALAADFRRINPQRARVILIEAGKRLLATFPESLSDRATLALSHLGVEIRLGRAVSAVDANGLQLGDMRIEAATVIWAAGVAASPAGRWLGAETDTAGRVLVQPDLTLPGHPEVFVIGDTSKVAAKPLPGIAVVAKQQGRYVGRVIAARARGKTRTKPFRYRNVGSWATIGRQQALIHLDSIRLSGFVAWVLWSVAHVYFLIGFRNRIVVAFDWLVSYLTFRRGARLITGPVDT
jgi:NADH dehydrogenase